MRIYDIKISNFLPYQPLFDKYARENNIDFQAIEKSSLDPSIVEDVDVLYIDTLHTPSHLKKELELHQESVKHTIICHDTYANPNMHRAIEDFCKKYPWQIVTYNTNSVGFTTIDRISG